ncbi:ImmA/IrrE family metallo-endopeptidase [Hyphobacterium sp. SN044]|uniref:ImmA/IrrE family metallo-endopeptidase n=1 Tax=Hyphobacterium sp. SN044 TaxID=2912575 RepID=UPI001F2ABFFB|nr:ImmA/IrrE family metallo-endopeptidase [Hyphobacterium sp. SN044]MCF8878605.1 ImmA/IrrE family metallo-endopeptidase [Hyphobacterium sp. SN044]
MINKNIQWIEEQSNRAPEERNTVCNLLLEINDVNVTEHLSEGSIFERICIPIYGIADGLVHEWWKLLGSRDGGVSILNFRSGYIVPNMSMHTDGEMLYINARSIRYNDSKIKFLNSAHDAIGIEDGISFLNSFVEEVISRLKDSGLTSTSLSQRWRRIKNSEVNGERDFCLAAGALGLDPYQIDDAAAEMIEKFESFFSGESLVEALSGSIGVDREKLLEWVQRMNTDTSTRYKLRELRRISDQLNRNYNPQSGPAWSKGYKLAHMARRALGMPEHAEFDNFKSLASKFGSYRSFALAPSVEGVKALRTEASDSIKVHVRDRGRSGEAQSSHLFALARAIGDAICFPESDISIVNDATSAYRQAAGRAFAAEFLAPSTEVKSMLEDKHDVSSISERFHVSESVIKHQIENNNRIEAAIAA